MAPSKRAREEYQAFKDGIVSLWASRGLEVERVLAGGRDAVMQEIREAVFGTPGSFVHVIVSSEAPRKRGAHRRWHGSRMK